MSRPTATADAAAAPARGSATASEALAPARGPEALAGLQGTIGNRAFRALLAGGPLQRKVRVGAAGDAWEQEAGRVAEAVVGAGAAPAIHSLPASGLQRACDACAEEDELRRLPGAGGAAHDVDEAAVALAGEGAPLAEAERAFFEPRFGRDFGAVRVHADARAAAAARAVGARAFTRGRDIAFADGEYRPGSTEGRRVLAHELTHVVQQDGGAAGAPVQRFADAGAPAATEGPAATAAEPAAGGEPVVESGEAPAGAEPTVAREAMPLVVDDEAAARRPGQMRKSALLAALRAAVSEAANGVLAASGRTTDDCPWIEHWFGFYAEQDAGHVERALRKFVPDTNAATARDYVPAVAARVQASVATWARTGEVTGVPEEAGGGEGAGPEAPGAEGAGNPLLLGRNGDLGPPGGAADPASIRDRLGPGRLLDASQRARMESAFGTDFGRVRVHTDVRAAGLSEHLRARAFTVGDHVAFGAGEYRPGTLVGDALLAHELAHVVQQEGGAARGVAPMETGGSAARSLEDDADRSAARAVASLWQGSVAGAADLAAGAMPRLRSGLGLRRCATGAQARRPAQAGPARRPAEGHPCGGSSLAETVQPSDVAGGASLPAGAFGNTSKLAAYFQFDACRVGATWRFYLKSLRMPISSIVPPAGFRIDVPSADAPVVTADTYRQIISDLAPVRSGSVEIRCGDQTFTDEVTTYSRRRRYWNRQLVVEHEAYHRREWAEYYRRELVRAEHEIWDASLPATEASSASDAVTRARSELDGLMIAAFRRACAEYSPHQESRAYDAGAPAYRALVDAIRARAVREGWTTAPPPTAPANPPPGTP
jgi:Domain of unknown function (DUF4157)